MHRRLSDGSDGSDGSSTHGTSNIQSKKPDRTISAGTRRQVADAARPEDLTPLMALGEADLRVIVMKMMKENSSLTQRLEEQENLVIELQTQLYELEDQLGKSRDNIRKHTEPNEKIQALNDQIEQLEEELTSAESKFGEQRKLNLSQDFRIASLKAQLENEHRDLQQVMRAKEQQYEELEESRMKAERLMQQLSAIPEQFAEEKSKRFAERMMFLVKEKRAAAAESNAQKRLRNLKHLYDMWSQEMDGEKNDLSREAFEIMANDTEESKEELVLRLHQSRMQVSKEKQLVAEMQAQMANKEREIAGQKIFMAVKFFLSSRPREQRQWRSIGSGQIGADNTDGRGTQGNELETEILRSEIDFMKAQVDEAEQGRSYADQKLSIAEEEVKLLRDSLNTVLEGARKIRIQPRGLSSTTRVQPRQSQLSPRQSRSSMRSRHSQSSPSNVSDASVSVE